MNRRTGIAVAGAVAGTVATLLLAACGITISQGTGSGSRAAFAPQRELLPDQQVQQVLNRFAFGGRPGDAAKVRAMGVDRWIALQLHPERIDDRATDRIIASYEMLGEPTAKVLESYREVRDARKSAAQRAGGNTSKPPSRDANGRNGAAAREAMREIARRNPRALDAARRVRAATTEVQSARLARAVISERQLQEVMVDFWENHFSVFAGKGLTRFFLADYERDAIRPHALGKFRDLLGAVAKSPAMLFYLDNWRSTADSTHPTLAALASGRARRRVPATRGVRGPTTPRRMPAAQQRPRRRSGLNENYGRELMELHTLGVDGGYTQADVVSVARCFTGWTFDWDIASPTAGKFRFEPWAHDSEPKTALGRAITTASGPGGIIEGQQVLDILAAHPSTARFVSMKLCRRFVGDTPPASAINAAAATFTSTDGDIRAVLRTIFTSPEFLASADLKFKRPFEWLISALRALEATVTDEGLDALLWWLLEPLGQMPFDWAPPNGYPDVAGAWMNTNGLMYRWNAASAVAFGWVPGVTVNLAGMVDALPARTIGAMVDAFAARFLHRALSPADRQVFADYAAEGGSTSATVRRKYLLERAPCLVALLLSSPHFQWR
jgi:uncharacterized protein (DUF1800 family)